MNGSYVAGLSYVYGHVQKLTISNNTFHDFITWWSRTECGISKIDRNDNGGEMNQYNQQYLS